MGALQLLCNVMYVCTRCRFGHNKSTTYVLHIPHTTVITSEVSHNLKYEIWLLNNRNSYRQPPESKHGEQYSNVNGKRPVLSRVILISCNFFTYPCRPFIV